MSSRRIQIILLAAAMALLAAGARAHAGGQVLRIEGADVYVSLGALDGVGTGSRLILYHTVEARNPVTGQVLRDSFPLGHLAVIRAGEHLAVAVAPGDIAHRIAVGDQVELASAARTFVDPWQQRIAARAARRAAGQAQPGQGAHDQAAAERIRLARQAVDQAEVATAAWQETLGKAPAERIAVWQAFLDDHADSPYAAAVTQEIASLRRQMTEVERLREQLADPEGYRAGLRVAQLAALAPDLALDGVLAVQPPVQVYEGQAVPLAFTVLAPGQVGGAWLYYRPRGEAGYVKVALRPDGDAYLRGAIPPDAIRPPGIEYFVEVAGKAPGSAPQATLGSQEAPRSLRVQPRVEERAPDRDDRSRVTMFMDYVDFDGGMGGGYDQYLHAEIDFAYRFLRPIYAVRVGFGTLGGVGGPKDVIDESEDCRDTQGAYRCRRVDYNYAYIELEHRFTDSVAILLRPHYGHGSSDLRRTTRRGRCADSDTAECDFFQALGLRARLRIGDERTTNLTLGMGITEDVGTVFEAAYTWSVIPRFPIKLSAQVTDQPVPEDYGVRLIADVGWRTLDWVYPSLRIAYQARDVDHSGVSGGIAANFDW